MKVRKRPIEVEAVQIVGVTDDEIAFEEGAHPAPWMMEALETGKVDVRLGGLVVDTLEGEMSAKAGDYILRGVKGEIYPVRADIFEATYDIVAPEG